MSNELQSLREAYKLATGKNPAPNMDADKLRAKIAEAKPDDIPFAADEPAAVEPAAPVEPAVAPAAQEPTASPVGTVYVRHEEGIGANYGGVALEPGKDGKILVPETAVEQLAAHGFKVV